MTRYVLAGLIFGLLALSLSAQADTSGIAIQVRETAGIRRFGYPVSAPVSLPVGVLKDRREARLVNSQGKSQPAQITATALHSDGSVRQLEIDFNLSPGPLETVQLLLEHADGVTGVEPKQGLTLVETAESYQVSAYTIRKDAQPLISNVRYGREYLKPGGLEVVAWSGDVEHSLRTATRHWTVEKSGPFQVRLRCEGVYPRQGELAELPFALTLEFVSTKSWVGLRHSVIPAASPDRHVSLGVVGNFQLDGRLLWDTDVNYWLYGVLEPAEQMTFTQRKDSWLCRLGKVGQQSDYAASVSGTPTGTPSWNPRSRRWGHFQEAREDGNVVAFGFDGSAAEGDYHLTMSSDGAMRWQGNPTDSQASRLNTFFHFVPVPAQHTARTSPAAMMAPLEVTVSVPASGGRQAPGKSR